MDAKTTRTLGSKWKTAKKLLDSSWSIGRMIEERDAWSAYVKACREVNECLTPYCTGKVEDFRRDGYCPVHREEWRAYHARMKMQRS
jgi:hypothetical protein